jgi:hypothetical protein
MGNQSEASASLISVETVKFMSKHNCRQCHGRGYHIIAPVGGGPEQAVTCTCVDNRLARAKAAEQSLKTQR